MDGTGATGTDKSGTRLKRYASQQTTADGAQVTTPVAWFRDMKLGVDCRFQRAEDGKSRCLPSSLTAMDVLNINLYSGSLYYLDSACTQKIVASTSCTKNPKYIVAGRTGTPTACQESTVFEVYAEPMAIKPTALYQQGLSCKALDRIALDELLAINTLYVLSSASYRPPTDFIEGESKFVLP